MSVINKMLRDLDARANPPSLTHPLQGTMTMTAHKLPMRWVGVGGPVVLVFMGWLGWSLATQDNAPAQAWWLETPTPVTAEPLDIQALAQQKEGLADEKEEVLEATRKPGAMLPKSLMLKLSAQMWVPPGLQDVITETNPGKTAQVALKSGADAVPATAFPQPLPSTSNSSTMTAPALSGTAATSSAASSVSTPSAVSPAPTGMQVNRQLAVQENLHQAQQLWQAGSRDAAMDMLHSTLQSAERSSDASNAQTLNLVREWARMALAQDRAPEVMALIKRHAAQLQGQADIWALQGHAAQRLGLHQEAVDAYSNALASRPHEARWMLASAVSLAATGQSDAAGRQLQKARLQGPVNPEILAYLKQAGVALP